MRKRWCIPGLPESALCIKRKSCLYLAIGTGARLNKSAIPATPRSGTPKLVLPKIRPSVRQTLLTSQEGAVSTALGTRQLADQVFRSYINLDFLQDWHGFRPGSGSGAKSRVGI